MVKKRQYLKGVEYYKAHLVLLSSLIPEKARLTLSETEVLAAFMEVYNGLFDKAHITLETRAKVKALLNMSSASLSQHITSMRAKGYIVLNKVPRKTFNIKEFLIPESGKQQYMIEFIYEDSKQVLEA